MRCALILFFIAVLAPACSTRSTLIIAPPGPPRVASPPVAQVVPAPSQAPARALATGCRAAPSTIYGDEPVVFEIEGTPSALPVDVELVDQAGHAVAKATAQVPGDWRPAAAASGDFRLQVGSNGVSCSVTVNRELARATSAAR